MKVISHHNSFITLDSDWTFYYNLVYNKSLNELIGCENYAFIK